MHAVLLTADLAGRTGPAARRVIPSALTPVAGSPLIVRQMRALARSGIKKLNIVTGDGVAPLRDFVRVQAAACGIPSVTVEGSQPAFGPLAAIVDAHEDVLIIEGSALFDLTLTALRDFHHARNALLTVVAQPSPDPRGSPLLREDKDLVTDVIPENRGPDEDERNLAPTGIYLASPLLFRHPAIRRAKTIIHDVVPALIADGERVACFRTSEYVRVLSTQAHVADTERDIRVGRADTLRLPRHRPAILFDVDGVLNEERPPKGTLRPDDVMLVPGAADAVRRARAEGYLTVAITNRPQLARGEITFEGLDHILGRLEALLAERGGLLDRIYVCPHHPAPQCVTKIAALAVPCDCRKPGSALFRRALGELPIDVKRSCSIGDSLRDIGAARAVGLPAFGVRTGYACADAARYPGGASAAPIPDRMFVDVGAAVDFMLSRKG